MKARCPLCHGRARIFSGGKRGYCFACRQHFELKHEPAKVGEWLYGGRELSPNNAGAIGDAPVRALQKGSDRKAEPERKLPRADCPNSNELPF